MTSPVVLGVDLGTSSVKVVLADAAGRVLNQATAAYPVQRPRPGWTETDPELWWTAICEATRKVLTTHPEAPVPVGLSGQMHGLVLCDDSGVPVRPAMLWSDTRAEPMLEVYRSLPAEIRSRLGNPLSPGMAGPMLGWLARFEPENYRRARWALQPKDWVQARPTRSP